MLWVERSQVPQTVNSSKCGGADEENSPTTFPL